MDDEKLYNDVHNYTKFKLVEMLINRLNDGRTKVDDMNSIDVGDIRDTTLNRLNDLPRYNWPDNKKPNDRYPVAFKIEENYSNFAFIAKTGDGKLILGDSYGSNNLMAAVRLEGAKLKSLIRDVPGDYSDIWPIEKAGSPVKVKKTIKRRRNLSNKKNIKSDTSDEIITKPAT